VGLFQWWAALKGIVSGIAWSLATGLAGVLVVVATVFVSNLNLFPPILHYYNPGCLSAGCDMLILDEKWIVGVGVLGLIVGLSAALPTGIVLSRYGSRVYMWLLGCLLAALLSLLAYIPFALVPGPGDTFLYFTVIGPVIIAVILAPFVYVTLHEPARLQRQQ
jgi:hypothetical protein